ncbi:hypothetical protein [Amycolatopsis anabasis]|uniref:hypothetical protein n=1 Tax=Amycolatopsis anabasis TaxID=1840409 RepID=UPI00131D420C|nr:hypothetical protein [Amycolatopsis anabasis]
MRRQIVLPLGAAILGVAACAGDGMAANSTPVPPPANAIGTATATHQAAGAVQFKIPVSTADSADCTAVLLVSFVDLRTLDAGSASFDVDCGLTDQIEDVTVESDEDDGVADAGDTILVKFHLISIDETTHTVVSEASSPQTLTAA